MEPSKRVYTAVAAATILACAGMVSGQNPACDPTFLTGQDIAPGSDIGAVGGTADNQACRDACMAFNGCNAAVRVDANGACFFKTVDLATIAPVPVPGLTATLLCGDTGGGDPVPEFCDQFLPATDIPGANLGALGGTADNAACLAACQTTAGCNAAIRVDSNGACFFKSVDFNAITPVSVPGLTSYVDCTPDNGECIRNGDASECPAPDSQCKEAVCDASGTCGIQNIPEEEFARCDINASGDGFCFEGDCVSFGICTETNLRLCSGDGLRNSCLEKNCMGIDPATGRGTCESIPKSPLPTECSSKFQDVGVCTEDGSCVPTPCDPANNAAECPPPLFYYSNCATPICTESGTCDFAIADAGTVCTPGFPEGNTVEDGVCNGRVCYGPGQCRTDFRGQCNAPTELCVRPFLPEGVDADLEPYIGMCKAF